VNKIVVILAIFTLVAVGIDSLRAAGDENIVAPLRTQWALTRDMVVNLAESIPESKYGYKPTPEVRTVREQLTHIVSENMFYMSMVAKDPPPDRTKLEALQTRKEIMQALRDSYAYGEKTLAALTDETAVETIILRGQSVVRWYPVLYNIQDNMDHYGNLVVYVRLNGMVPPKTAARQTQQQQR
jgi:uncharacterized damage-inducible protein DinB